MCLLDTSLVPTDAMSPHDLKQAGVVGEAEGLGRTGHVPLMPLQGRHDDPPLRLRLQLLEAEPGRRGVGWGRHRSDLQRHMIRGDDFPVRGDPAVYLGQMWVP